MEFFLIFILCFPWKLHPGFSSPPPPIHLLIIFNFIRWNLSKFLTCSSNICKNIIKMDAYRRPSIPPLSTPDISRYMRYFKSSPIKILNILKKICLLFKRIVFFFCVWRIFIKIELKGLFWHFMSISKCQKGMLPSFHNFSLPRFIFVSRYFRGENTNFNWRIT